MKIYAIEKRSEGLIQQLYEVWEKSVTATHTFLPKEEIDKIVGSVPDAVQAITHLIIAEGDDGRPAAFMGIEAHKLEMLFIDPNERGKGLGRQMIQYGIDNYALNRLCVNEQNPQAIGFYEHMGFEVIKRTDLDEQGNPYPLLYMKPKVDYRYAEIADIPVILDFIKGLAAYEKMSDQVVATEELLEEWLFQKKKAEVILASVCGKAIGFALFFHNFSTFLGRAGIYLEDLYILPEYRNCGYGKGMLKQLAKIAVERGCGRLEWACLDWNQPSIEFYLSLGAEQMADWTVYRLTGETLEKTAE